MSTVSLLLDEIFDLAKKTLLANGCDDETASILSDLIDQAQNFFKSFTVLPVISSFLFQRQWVVDSKT